MYEDSCVEKFYKLEYFYVYLFISVGSSFKESSMM